MVAEFEAIAGGRVRAAGAEDAIDGVQPAVVAEPETVEEASVLLALANREGLAVAIRGAGTKLGWGNVPSRLDLVLSTARLNRVLEHAAGDLVVRVQAGTRLHDVQAALAPAGQWLALDPSESNGTIGGIIASNDAGPHRLRYGSVRDLLIGITYVLPDGTVAKAGGKVVKNVAGYDLDKLFTGSLGTLGLVAEAIFRLHPRPAVARLLAAPGDDGGMSAGQLGDAVQRILHSTVVPSALDFAWREDSARLFVLLEGVEAGVASQSEHAMELLADFGGADEVEAPEARRSLPDEATTGLKISLPLAALPAAIDIVRSVAEGRHISPTMWGHAASGITYVGLAGTDAAVLDTIGAIRQGIAAMGGSVVVRAAPLDVKRALDVWGDAGDTLPLMRAVKRQFDPNGIMNPGRFVGGI